MKKIIFCFSFVCMGLIVSCVDKNELVDEENKPGWLGESIYGELQNPADKGLLSGTFNTYLRLVDDLNYADVLSRTGSMTVFPANDEAFERFFKSGTWPGVHSYADLTISQKRLLLNSSMLRNALLTNMLSNVAQTGSSGNVELTPGMTLKHKTAVGDFDSVTYYPFATAQEVYKNNSNWGKFDAGVAVVSDATTPMMLHFTPDYIMNNGFTYSGSDNDMAILVGKDYDSKDTYIFRNRVVAPDVTCQNGYIHQVSDVIVPPGNMAAVMKNADDLTIVSHLFDRFAIPVYNSKVTNDYHDWYKEERDAGHDMTGIINPDSIFEVRYLSEKSQYNSTTRNYVFNNGGKGSELLSIDIGWNEYYSGDIEAQALMDVAALFVPTDDVIQEFFINGAGASIMKMYCQDVNDSPYPLTKENVIKNVDYIPDNVINKLLSNMMQPSFRATVPSKFSMITDMESGDFMGITADDVVKTADGNADVRIANNGVVYVMNRVLSPNSYSAVSAPTLFNSNMNVINWMIENKSMNGSSPNPYSIGLDFYAYLLAMQANFALFLPTDEAFELCYVDPASLKKSQPTAVRYVWRGVADEPRLRAVRHTYDPATNTIGDSIAAITFNSSTMPMVRAQLSDLMNYCTIVLNSGEKLGDNGKTFYKAKNGGGLKIELNGNGNVTSVSAGGQYVNGLPKSNVVNPDAPYNQDNGVAYPIDNVLQTPQNSVYSILNDNVKYPQFQKFFQMCNVLSNTQILKWVFGYEDAMTETERYNMNSFRVFTDKEELNNTLDYNIRFFNKYNYTAFIPNNTAMDEAMLNGLPDPTDVNETYRNYVSSGDLPESILAPIKEDLKNKIKAMRDFVYYHFVNTSVYIDNVIEGGDLSSFLVRGDTQQSVTVKVGGSANNMTVTDAMNHTQTLSGTADAVNIMTRDYEFERGSSDQTATYVESSSFAVIHEISKPLYYNTNFGTPVSNAKSRMSTVRKFK